MDADIDHGGPTHVGRSASAYSEGRGMRPDGAGDTGEPVVVPPVRDAEGGRDAGEGLREGVPAVRRRTAAEVASPKPWHCMFKDCPASFVHARQLVGHLFDNHGDVR